MTVRNLFYRASILSILALLLLSSAAICDASVPSDEFTGNQAMNHSAPMSFSANEPLSLSSHALDELVPQASAYLDTRAGDIGIAVIVPDEGVVYSYNGDALFDMASIAKVPIMLSVLDQADQDAISLTPAEEQLLQAMITYSDNDAADALWWDVGGAPAVGAYLDSIGVKGIQPDPDGYWGESLASPKAMAQLLSELIQGEALDASGRALAVDLMGEVTPTQRWGVMADIDGETSPGWTVGLKNGWYPADDGWWVNSVGFVVPDGGQPYVIAIMTDEQPSLDYGIDTIETVAHLMHAALGAPIS